MEYCAFGFIVVGLPMYLVLRKWKKKLEKLDK